MVVNMTMVIIVDHTMVVSMAMLIIMDHTMAMIMMMAIIMDYTLLAHILSPNNIKVKHWGEHYKFYRCMVHLFNVSLLIFWAPCEG